MIFIMAHVIASPQGGEAIPLIVREIASGGASAAFAKNALSAQREHRPRNDGFNREFLFHCAKYHRQQRHSHHNAVESLLPVA